MTRDDILRFFDARQAHWRARNAEALAAGHTADAVVVSPMFGALQTPDEIVESYRRLFATFPDWLFKSEELIVDGARVAQHFIATATHVGEFMGLPGTNRHGRIEGVMLYQMKDGGIARERRLYDYSALLIQIGVLRSKPNF
jgi:steroid delta-isomerase-like uncharacterized protein